MKKLAFAVAMAAGASCSLMAAVKSLGGTNTWTGAGGDFLWSNTANWSALNCQGESIDPATFATGTTPCVFDFSALGNGQTVTNDLTGSKVFPMGFIFKADAVGDHWGVVSKTKDCYAVNRVDNSIHPCFCIVPEGCTFDFGLNWSNNYGSEGTLVVSGGGTFALTAPHVFDPYQKTFQMENSILEVTTRLCAGFTRARVALSGNNAKLKLDKNQAIMALWSEGDGTPTVDLQSYTLTLNNGYAGGVRTFGGTITGTGALTMDVGVVETLSGSYAATGPLTLYNSDLVMGAGCGLNESTAVSVELTGRLRLSQSQTFKKVSGKGVTGGVEIPSGATLTVSGTSGGADRLNGRLTGDGGFALDAPGYVYTLSGDSRYAGGTQVKAGTLTVGGYAPPSVDLDEGLIFYLPFENSVLEDVSDNHYAFKTKVHNSQVNAELTDGGRVGRGAEMTKASVQSPAIMQLTGNHSFTYSCCFNFDKAEYGTYNYLGIHGKWNNKGLAWFYLGSSGTKIVFRLLGYVDGTSKDRIVSYTLPDGAEFGGSGWRHAAFTYDAETRKMTVYLDGKSVASDTHPYGATFLDTMAMTVGSYYDADDFRGQMDEVKFLDRAWSADQVKAEYERCTACLKADANAADILPEPVAHWAFDDAADVGKDSGPYGYDLGVPSVINMPAKTTTKSFVPNAPTVVDQPGAYGKCAKFEGTTGKNVLAWCGPDFPEHIPTGNAPFSVSVRVSVSNPIGPTIVGWGDAYRTNEHVRVAFGSSPSYTLISNLADGNSHNGSLNKSGDVNNGRGSIACSRPNGGNLGESVNWAHVVYTWNPQTKTITSYWGGSKHTSSVSFLFKEIDGQAVTGLDLKPQDLIVGCNTRAITWSAAGLGSENVFSGYVDDIRIYDCTLSDSQVECLARSMETGSVGPSLPAGGTVSVASGATLRILGGANNALSSLQNAGTVDVNGAARVSVGGGTIGGTLTGCGTLCALGGDVTLSANGDAFSGWLTASNGSLTVEGAYPNARILVETGGAVTGSALKGAAALADGLTIVTDAAGTGLPLVVTAGTVTIPAHGKVVFSQVPQPGRFEIASGDLIEAPDALSGWTAEGAEPLKVKFSVTADKKRFRMTVCGGLMVIVR